MQNRLLEGMNGIFWTFFIVLGIFVFLRSVEIVVGILVVLLGIHRVGSELKAKKLYQERDQLQTTLEDIREWLQREYEYSRDLSDKYDSRFFNVNKNRNSVNKKIEKNRREVVRKILELENKMNEVSRAFLTKAPRSGKK